VSKRKNKAAKELFARQKPKKAQHLVLTLKIKKTTTLSANSLKPAFLAHPVQRKNSIFWEFGMTAAKGQWLS
jgi:hypothetical protein